MQRTAHSTYSKGLRALLVLGLMTSMAWSQEKEQEKKEGDIGTETVTVVKSYTPTVSEAIKINSQPSIGDSLALKKKSVQYSIFSIPVASTFTPAKGKAATLKKEAPEELYNSYVALGVGNYSNAVLDAYTGLDISRNERVDFSLNHHSSRGDVEGVVMHSDFYRSQLGGQYSNRQRDMDWGAGFFAEHQQYSWYGIPVGAFTDDELLGVHDAKQHYFNVEATADLAMEDSFYKRGDVLFRHFWDRTGSGESRAKLNLLGEVPIAGELIDLGIDVDYVGGAFDWADLNSASATPGNDYSLLQFAATPSFLLIRDNLSVHLGATVAVGLDFEDKDTDIHFYPKVTAAYKVLDDMVIGYGGVEGGLYQNSYHDFVEANPYVSPTLAIHPTSKQYDVYAGLKGSLGSIFGYDFKLSYASENDKALFALNPVNLMRQDDKSYNYGNSFRVLYDNVRTFGAFGQFTVDVNRSLSMTLNATYNSFDTSSDNPAWNLPQFKSSLFLDYQIDEHWYAGTNLFYVGERKDLYSTAFQPGPSPVEPTEITLDAFFDANVYAGYRFNEQFSFFIKGNNLLNNEYQQWADFPVQGLQILGGAAYKFNL